MELDVKEVKELIEVIENIEKRQGLVAYFYLETVDTTKIYLKKYNDLEKEIKNINPTSKVLFTKINAEKSIEIKEFYQIEKFPCIYIYYLREQKAAFIPKNEMEIEREINI